MAKIEFSGIAEYQRRLAELGARAEGVCKYAIYDAAGMVVEEIKKETPVDTGDLRDSAALKPMRTENGFVFTQVAFEGYDRKGVPNALKARVLESGNSTHRKRPFIRPTIKRVAALANFMIEKALNEKITEIMNQKG